MTIFLRWQEIHIQKKKGNPEILKVYMYQYFDSCHWQSKIDSKTLSDVEITILDLAFGIVKLKAVWHLGSIP